MIITIVIVFCHYRFRCQVIVIIIIVAVIVIIIILLSPSLSPYRCHYLYSDCLHRYHFHYGCNPVETCVVERLTTRTLDRPGSSLARSVVSLDKELYSILSLFTQVYK